jgi:hypothetical protein
MIRWSQARKQTTYGNASIYSIECYLFINSKSSCVVLVRRHSLLPQEITVLPSEILSFFVRSRSLSIAFLVSCRSKVNEGLCQTMPRFLSFLSMQVLLTGFFGIALMMIHPPVRRLWRATRTEIHAVTSLAKFEGDLLLWWGTM